MTQFQWMQRLIEASARGQPALTVELARLHLADNPDDYVALMLCAGALIDLGRYAEARSALEHALSLARPERR